MNWAAQRHLCAFAIGPVQSFIAAARRTRDLWYGSTLLALLAAAAADCLRQRFAAEVIFPASAPAAQANRQYAGMTNKIVCVVSTSDVFAIARQVRAAVQLALDQEGQRCLDALQKARTSIDQNLFTQQLQQTVDCYAAWALWPEVSGDDSDAGYAASYAQANLMLDARKRLRDFGPNLTAQPGARLSSLDGARETVIPTGPLGRRLRAAFGIDETEELDAVGLIKRVLGREAGFPAVTRVAIQPWVASWPDDACAELADCMERLAHLDLAGKNRCTPPDPMARFPFDGELLLPARRTAFRRCVGDFAEAAGVAPATITDAIDEVEMWLEERDPSGKQLLLPMPKGETLYVAMLLADGDHMGPLLGDAQCDRLAHLRISAALAIFAGQTSGIVASHGGTCIYSGGDDVMAILPVDSALACARALAEDFHNTLQPAVPELAGTATLSVGVAFAHVLTPFGDLRELAKCANQLAKNGPDGRGLRNALGIVVQPRNGAAVQACGQWDEANTAVAGGGFDARMRYWQLQFEDGQLSGSAPYDLMALADHVPAGTLPAEAQRLLKRRGASDSKILAQVMHCLQVEAVFGAVERHRRMANEWYIARWLAAHPKPPSVPASPTPATPTAQKVGP